MGEAIVVIDTFGELFRSFAEMVHRLLEFELGKEHI